MSLTPPVHPLWLALTPADRELCEALLSESCGTAGRLTVGKMFTALGGRTDMLLADFAARCGCSLLAAALAMCEPWPGSCAEVHRIVAGAGMTTPWLVEWWRGWESVG